MRLFGRRLIHYVYVLSVNDGTRVVFAPGLQSAKWYVNARIQQEQTSSRPIASNHFHQICVHAAIYQYDSGIEMSSSVA